MALVTVGERQQTPYPARAWNPEAEEGREIFFLTRGFHPRSTRTNNADTVMANLKEKILGRYLGLHG